MKELEPPTTLSHYRIVSSLSAGGMREIYRAHDEKLNGDVAIIFLPEAYAVDESRLVRFKREAQVLPSLNHPDIAATFGREDSTSVIALVAELVDGPNLAQLIATSDIPLENAT